MFPSQDATTASFLSDPEYVNKLKALQANPQLLGTYLADQKIAKSLGVLLGLPANLGADFPGADGDDAGAPFGAGAGASPFGAASGARAGAGSGSSSSGKNVHVSDHDSDDDQEMTPAGQHHQPHRPAAAAAKEEPKKEEKVEEDESLLTQEEKDARALRKKSDEEKEKGTAAYKKRDFDTALKHYAEALKIDSSNATCMSNIAAVYFEQGQFEKCVEECQATVKVSSSLVARSMTHLASWVICCGG